MLPFVVEPEAWLLAWIVCELLALIYNGMVEMVEAVGSLCFGPDAPVPPVGHVSEIGYEELKCDSFVDIVVVTFEMD